MKKTLLILLMISFIIPMFAAPVTAAPNIAGRIAIVMDFETGEILYERGAHTRWIPASMTKTLTAFIVYEEIEAGNITMDTYARVSAFASRIASGGYGVQGNHVSMRAGSYVRVEDLLLLNMLPSSNGASVVLAELISGSEAAFVQRMNSTAYALGMYPGFVNAHGATVNHTTAYSIAILTREFIRRFPDILRITSQSHMYFEGRRQSNTNLLVRPDSEFFRPSVDGFKTGIIREAGWGHSVTEYRDGRRIIAVVMNSTDNPGRHRDSLALLDFGFAEAARRDVYREEALRAEMEINAPYIILNGEQMYFDVPPIITNGRTLVPFRAILETLGAWVYWNEDDGLVAAYTYEKNIRLTVGDSAATVISGGVSQTVWLDVPPTIMFGRTLVPLRFVAETLGARVNWDYDSWTITIDTIFEDEDEQIEVEQEDVF